jgi:hypothetical protein
MAGITYFVALPFDVADGSVVVGEPIECLTPATAIERAQGLWKVLGHTGAVAFSRTGDPATGDFHAERVEDKILETYLGPNRTLQELRDFARKGGMNFLNEFSEACREELAVRVR